MQKTVDLTTNYTFYNNDKPADITMGWEYEIDNPEINNEGETELIGYDSVNRKWTKFQQTIAKELGDEFKFCIDGSHTYYKNGNMYNTLGLEVRSPVGPTAYAKMWARQLLPFTEVVKEHNGDFNNGGIHINISKNEYTDKRWERVRNFLHNPKYYSLLLKISDRADNKFRANAPQTGDGNGKFGIITRGKRYAYEIRMFGAHTEVFIPAIDFSDAVFRYASDDVSVIKPDPFFSWIDSKRNYVNLSRYIHKKLA